MLLSDMSVPMLTDCGRFRSLISMVIVNKIKFKGKKLESTTKLLLDCLSKEILISGECFITARIGNDQFQENILILGLNKHPLGNSFLK